MNKMKMMAIMLMATVCAQAQSDVEPYFTTKEMPDMLKWCPAPPDTHPVYVGQADASGQGACSHSSQRC